MKRGVIITLSVVIIGVAVWIIKPFEPITGGTCVYEYFQDTVTVVEKDKLDNYPQFKFKSTSIDQIYWVYPNELKLNKNSTDPKIIYDYNEKLIISGKRIKKGTCQPYRIDTVRPHFSQSPLLHRLLPSNPEFRFTVLDDLAEKMVRDSLESDTSWHRVFSDQSENLYWQDSLAIEKGNLFQLDPFIYVTTKKFNGHESQFKVFKNSNSTLNPLISQTIWSIIPSVDTIADINGDGRLDYAINWQPDSGCCLRDIWSIYLLKEDGSFTEKIELTNPTFFPDKKLVKGLTYGHIGHDAALYTVKWDNLNPDTLEIIYPNPNDSIEYTFKYWKGDNPNYKIISEIPSGYEDTWVFKHFSRKN